ncbi:MAG: hypothetical protein VB071_07230 [Lawsonibacter sp.]|nr:hypothetical protein [Lawsonibacter sp.]
MRKLLLCVPMITLLLLPACSGGSGVNKAEELSLTIRGEYLEATSWTADVTVTADYGQRVYQYQLTAAASEDETVLTLSKPETVAGITARLTGKDSVLEYDGMSLETGPLDENGLTPVSAIPALMDAVRSGYITACALEEGESGSLLRLDCGDPEGQPSTGVEMTLWFDADTHALVRGEISLDGFQAVLCEFSNFTKE